MLHHYIQKSPLVPFCVPLLWQLHLQHPLSKIPPQHTSKPSRPFLSNSPNSKLCSIPILSVLVTHNQNVNMFILAHSSLALSLGPVRHSRSHYCLTNLTLSPSLLHLSTLTKFFLDLLLFWLSDKDNKTINQRHFLCKLPFVQQASIIVPGWSRGSLSQGRYDRHNWLYLFYIYPSQMPGYFPYLHV